MGTARRGSVKVGAVALAAVIGVFTPGVGPMSAAAQEQPSGEEPAPAWAPIGNIGGPPADSKGPDTDYLERVRCITSASTASRNPEAEILKNGPWAQRHLRLPAVHQYVREKSPTGKIGVKTNGDPLRVAVIDTGVTKHPFFQNRVKAGGDYVEKGGLGKNGLEDCDGHGTQVAGIIGANPQDSEIGFIGVAPDVEIISIRQSSQNFSEITGDELKQRAEEKKQEREAKEREAELERQRKEAEADRQRLEEELEKQKQEDAEEDKKDTNSSSAGIAARQPGGQAPNEPRAQENTGGAGNLGTLAEAIVRAVKADVDVINMSVDACRPNSGTYEAIGDEAKVRAAIKYAADQDVVVVAAAGNAVSDPNSLGGCIQNDVRTQGDPRMPDPNHPRTVVTPPWFSADGNMLAVGSIGLDGGVSSFSMRGPWVSVAAPGEDIISLDPAEGSRLIVNVTFDGDNKKAQPLQGTSFSAPYVAGLAVLVRQMHPKLKARQIIERIERTAQHPGASDGRDQFVGFGVIDPMAAVSARLPSEMGLPEAQDRQLASDMPSLREPDTTPMIVALAGAGGGIAALLITMFVVRTVRRRDEEPS